MCPERVLVFIINFFCCWKFLCEFLWQTDVQYGIKMFRSWSTLSRRYSGVRERAAVWSSRPRIIPPNTATDPLSPPGCQNTHKIINKNRLSFHPGSYICAPNVFPEHTQDHQQAITFLSILGPTFVHRMCFQNTRNTISKQPPSDVLHRMCFLSSLVSISRVCLFFR